MENRRRSRTNSQSDPIRRGRGRPKTVGLKKQEEEKGEAFNCYRFKDAKHLEYKKGRDPFFFVFDNEAVLLSQSLLQLC